ncbi:MAG: ABC transporter substrate-binding protein [Magnetospirillum sp.]|nr:ABC transporter substrate-binding protein [Magnetospirillum sp.]
MPRRILGLFASFYMVIAALMPSDAGAAALDGPTAEALVRSAVADASASFAGGPFTREQTRAKVAALVEKYADITFESELILGRYWRKATPEQQGTFSSLLIPFFVATYGSLMDNAPVRPEMVFLGTETRADAFVVHTKLKPSVDDEVNLDFVVLQSPAGKAVISDATAEGVALVTTIRSDFTSVIRNAGGNIAVLLDAMRKKIDAPPPAPPASGNPG